MWKKILILLLTVVVVVFQACSYGDVTEPEEQPGQTSDLADKALQRPFSDFMDTQGTFCWPDGEGGCIDFEPPMKNFLGWTDPTNNFNALFECLGNADLWLQEQSGGTISLGTEITGTVSERPLRDGRALITVNVHARNILAWMTDVEDFYLDPLVFGYRVGDVLEGAPPALADAHYMYRFINSEQNAPIPDIFGLYFFPEPGQEFVHISVSMSATGVLHEGSGYPEGTLARVHVTQVYTGQGGLDDTQAWPVERINITPIGQP